MVALGLLTRSKAQVDAGDLHALQSIEQRLVKELERLDKIRKAADAIRRQVDAIDQEVATGQKKVGKLVADAKKTLTALNIELRDEQEERESPLVVQLPVPENDVVAAIAE